MCVVSVCVLAIPREAALADFRSPGRRLLLPRPEGGGCSILWGGGGPRGVVLDPVVGGERSGGPYLPREQTRCSVGTVRGLGPPVALCPDWIVWYYLQAPSVPCDHLLRLVLVMALLFRRL